MSLDDELYGDFVQDTAPLVAQLGERLAALERAAEAMADEWKAVLGFLHTIKGNFGMMGLAGGQTLAHAMEQRAKAAQDEPVRNQPVMVAPLLTAVGALEQAMNPAAAEELPLDLVAGELGRSVDATAVDPVAAQTLAAMHAPQRISHLQMPAATLDRLLELAGELASYHGQASAAVQAAAAQIGAAGPLAGGLDALEALGKRVASVRQRVLDARLVPLSPVVGRLDRLVRDLARGMAKDVTFVVEGSDTVVDKSLADAISEPLLHMIRNAIDHGVETPDERRAAGKVPQARLELRIAARGGELVVTLSDDGRGISTERLAAVAAERGVSTKGWSERQILDLVFASELSTAERVTELSGRGVGMHQVRRAVERLGGAVDVTSESGRGTRFRLRLPLAAAIRRTLLVDCAGERYAIPVDSVVEVFRVDPDEVYPLDQGFVTAWRSRVLPAHYLAQVMAGTDAATADDLLCVVVHDDDRSLGLMVSRLIGQQEVVVKELDPALGRPRGISGVALIHDGTAAMVLDPRGLVQPSSNAGGAA